MIDTHCHINTEQFDLDYEKVIEDAASEGLEKIIAVGFDPKSNQRALELAENYDIVYASAGIHPSDVDGNTCIDLPSFYKHDKVIAVGECGIDLYWRNDNLELQKNIFIEQIELSIKYHLPLIIHTRNSFKEAYDCVKPYTGKAFGVFHCFSSNLDDARLAVDLGYYIGIDGPVTFKNAPEIKEIAKEIPLDKIVIETDSPYLSPHPYRGKRNEPKRLKLIAKAIADIKEIPIEEVIRQTSINARRLFQLGDDNNEN